MREAFHLQHDASRNLPKASLSQRSARIGKIAEIVSEFGDGFAQAVAEDFGSRSSVETGLIELTSIAGAAKHARKHLRKWMRPKRAATGLNFFPGKAEIRPEPLGVVGIISPWNYPVSLAFLPLIDALAAGNRVLIKPSELTPRTSQLLTRVIAEKFRPEEVRVIEGDGEVAAAFSALPFDHLLFTGSTEIGRKVMAAAAPNLTPVTLELGGKSPALLCPDYPLEKAAKNIAFGKFINSGQTCIAPDYVLAPRDKVSTLAESILANSQSSYPDLEDNQDYTSIISTRHRDRLIRAIAEAQAGGARILTHKERLSDNSGKLAPHVILDAPDDCLLLQEEIFGPVLPIIPYDNLDDAIAYINDRDRPLALYAFTDSARTREKMLGQTMSGGATINGTLLHAGLDSMPFGGVGASGMGAYHGYDGFCRLSHFRSVYRPRLINGLERLGPPWGKLARMMIQHSTNG